MIKFSKNFLLVVVFLLFFIQPVLADEKTSPANRVNVYFFYGNDCPQCIKEKQFIKDLKAEISGMLLYSFETQNNRDNADLLKTLSGKLGLGDLNVPLLIVGDRVFPDFYSTEDVETEIRTIIEEYLISGYTDVVVQSTESNQDKQALVLAQLDDEPRDRIFLAEVIEIIKQQQTTLPDGTIVEQQDLKLLGLDKEFAGQEIEFKGIGEFDVVKKNIYQVGDKVLVAASFDVEGKPYYYITDYVRTGSLWWLVAVFALSLFIVGGWKGLRSLLALIVTFFVIIKYIIPSILDGASPLVATLIGSVIILLVIIYLTEGFRARSHISIISIFLSLIITIFLSWFFVGLTKLSGLASEEVYFLINIGGEMINFKGLLLAGIIIGTLGVLDDVVVSQVATVEQIKKANQYQSRREIFKSAYQVGVSHISSMTNTLFLAYAGVSLPLLILFVSGESAFASWSQVVNYEAMATEIVRTLAGSIGLILSVPISTLVAVWWYKSHNV